jgi:hypothetical protein
MGGWGKAGGAKSAGRRGHFGGLKAGREYAWKMGFGYG